MLITLSLFVIMRQFLEKTNIVGILANTVYESQFSRLLRQFMRERQRMLMNIRYSPILANSPRIGVCVVSSLLEVSSSHSHSYPLVSELDVQKCSTESLREEVESVWEYMVSHYRG